MRYVSSSNTLFAAAVVAGLFIQGCGSSDSSTTSGPTTLAALPSATGAVTTASTAANLNSIRGAVGHSTNFAAESGLELDQWSSTAWTSTKSGPKCLFGQDAMLLWMQASEPEVITCYIAKMHAAGLFTGDVFDGTEQIYVLNGLSQGEQDGPPDGFKVKFKISKASDGAINSFQMWMCSDGSSQDSYVGKIASGSTYTVTTKNVKSDGDQSGSEETEATGVVDSNGNWTSKSISSCRQYSDTGGGSDDFSHNQCITMTQYSDIITMSSYMNGTHSHNGQTKSFSAEMYAAAQIIGFSDDNIGNDAIGDGSSKFSFTHNDNGSDETFTNTLSWNGDTSANLTDASSGTYYTTANNGTLPTQQTVEAPTFDGAEAWDCSGTATTIQVTAAQAASLEQEFQACEKKHQFSGGRDYVNCHSADFD